MDFGTTAVPLPARSLATLGHFDASERHESACFRGGSWPNSQISTLDHVTPLSKILSYRIVIALAVTTAPAKWSGIRAPIDSARDCLSWRRSSEIGWTGLPVTWIPRRGNGTKSTRQIASEVRCGAVE